MASVRKALTGLRMLDFIYKLNQENDLTVEAGPLTHVKGKGEQKMYFAQPIT